MDRAELLGQLARAPALAATAADRPAQQLDDGWSPVVVVGHLGYVDRTLWLPRLHQMADEERPRWPWWEPDGVDWSGLFADRQLIDVAAEFERSRQGLVDYLAALPEPGWDRRARHDVFGDIDVAGLCTQIVNHDHEHVEQITGQPAPDR